VCALQHKSVQLVVMNITMLLFKKDIDYYLVSLQIKQDGTVLKLFKNFSLFPVILLALFSRTAIAENLCDSSCDLHIDFTVSGSIEAVEALTITFGSGGVINDGSVATGYSAGETLLLNAGDTLVFNAGGVLDLGDAGNIDYTAMNLNVDGDMSIAAVGGSGSISFHGDSHITLNGAVSLESDASLAAQLNLPNNATLMSGAGVLSVDTGGMIVSGTVFTGKSQLIFGSSTPFTTGYLNELQEGTLTVDTSTLLSQSDLIDFQGVTFPVDMGNSCTVNNGKCFDASGTEYRVENGVFTAVSGDKSGNSGSVNFFNILFLFLLYLAFIVKVKLIGKYCSGKVGMHYPVS
jgi:hypothetical protein